MATFDWLLRTGRNERSHMEWEGDLQQFDNNFGNRSKSLFASSSKNNITNSSVPRPTMETSNKTSYLDITNDLNNLSDDDCIMLNADEIIPEQKVSTKRKKGRSGDANAPIVVDDW